MAEEPDLTVVGPEVALVKGIKELFTRSGFKLFGPSGHAAEIEGSKAFCKRLCTKFGIPTADYRVVDTMSLAQEVIVEWGAPIVEKDDGLAAGKGVKVAGTVPDAFAFAEKLFSQKGRSGPVVIERMLEGRECSVMALCDGTQAYLLAPARDYKRANDRDCGENTGGMGAYSPLPDVDDALLTRIKEEIIDKLVDALRRTGRRYYGVLYAGIMLTEDGPILLEVNCRFGDPETQVVLPRLKSDLLPYLLACTKLGGLSELPPLEWHDGTTVAVVLANKEYPERKDLPEYFINGIDQARATGALVFHAGTKYYNDTDRLVSSGGRVLNIVGQGATFVTAHEQAYRAIGMIENTGFRYRTDIAAEL
jgi:phosphoribosylamine--glycine ligase